MWKVCALKQALTLNTVFGSQHEGGTRFSDGRLEPPWFVELAFLACTNRIAEYCVCMCVWPCVLCDDACINKNTEALAPAAKCIHLNNIRFVGADNGFGGVCLCGCVHWIWCREVRKRRWRWLNNRNAHRECAQTSRLIDKSCYACWQNVHCHIVWNRDVGVRCIVGHYVHEEIWKWGYTGSVTHKRHKRQTHVFNELLWFPL